MSSNLLEEGAALGLENAEALAKHFFASDGLARELPYVSSALKLVSLSRSISDRLLARKLAVFFEALHKVPEVELAEMYQRLLASSESAKRVGEVTLLTIDRLNALDKPKWVALVVLGHLERTINFEELRRVLSAIDQTITVDLEQLVARADAPPDAKAAFLAAFVPTGLAVVHGAGQWGDGGVLLYTVSSLGKKVAALYRKWGVVVAG